ncbi:hypothetical protein [Thermococcus sp.]|uniref:hypothetical protein n=1 Tax=Thermococcus sp. TaxID=35749 RepID=UPI00262A4AA5|nr:hypothetical protein [Thermococcus sp.]
MAVKEGHYVKRLDDKLGYGAEDISTIIYFFGGVFVFATIFSITAFNFEGEDFLLALLVSFFVSLIGFTSLWCALRFWDVDAQDFVEAFRKDNPEEAEIEILNAGYSKARTRVKDALTCAVATWLIFGGYAGAIEIATLQGMLTIKNWIIIGILHILAFVGFVLTIVFYLRKRSIEKALFAIQLKKSDKAEISIKL